MYAGAESDAILLDRVAERDESALRELYDRHAAWLLLRLLASVMPPSAGRITLGDLEITGSHADRTEARRSIGCLPQEVVFPHGMTAFGFLDYVAILKEWDQSDARHREIRRVLDLVALSQKGGRQVSKLSGGQRRRLAIAQALIGSPPCSCSTSPRPVSTPSSEPPCAASSPHCPGSWCCRPTRPRMSRLSATAWWSSMVG